MGDSIYVKALKLEKGGNWEEAHRLIQDLPDQKAAWIHAYLHRVGGDQWNAEYWYRKASKPVFEGSLEDEWQYLFETLSQ